jgi:hypothetical protein
MHSTKNARRIRNGTSQPFPSSRLTVKRNNQTGGKMKRLLMTLMSTALAVALISPTPAHAGSLHRIVSQFFDWDGTESEASDNLAGVPIYQHSFFVTFPSTNLFKPDFNVAYISLFSTSDVSSGAMELRCFLDGSECNTGLTQNAVPQEGTVALNTISSSDQGVAYEWCARIIQGGPHSFLIKMLSEDGSSDVFIEGAYVNIDLVFISNPQNACTTAPNLSPA